MLVNKQMKYYLYHIPNKKIGVTQNLNNRVTQQQGYDSDEYEILIISTDIDYISLMEIELQKAYGYPVDNKTYNNLIKSNKMKKNGILSTETTTTFNCEPEYIKPFLERFTLESEWDVPTHGIIKLNEESGKWIIKNIQKSFKVEGTCYIYNKAFFKYFKDDLFSESTESKTVYDYIRQWAKERGIYSKGNSTTQYVKLMEEAGELAKALLEKDRPEIIDAIGDIVVVLTNLAELENLKIEDCVESAYNVIKARQGKMINGTFVKQKI